MVATGFDRGATGKQPVPTGQPQLRLRLGDFREWDNRSRFRLQPKGAATATRPDLQTLIWLALGQKAFLFHTQIRPKGPKTGKTKSWDGIHVVDQMLRLHAQIYRSAREALIDLQASKLITDRFKPLEAAQLKTSTTLLNPSESGWKHGQLPWFWYLDVAGDSISATHLRECKSLASHDLMPF